MTHVAKVSKDAPVSPRAPAHPWRAHEPAPAPAADAPEWTSESDDASATGEEDEVDKAEGEERVAQTAVDRDVAPLTPAVATMSQALVPLSQEAARTPWVLLCEANEQRHRATTEERARLAPEVCLYTGRLEGW